MKRLGWNEIQNSTVGSFAALRSGKVHFKVGKVRQRSGKMCDM